MSWSNLGWCFVASWLFPLLLGAALSAQVKEESGWETAFEEIAIQDGRLVGPGAERLLSRCRDCQFILFGEAHGVRGVAEIVAATHQSLPREPLHHLVLEAGDWFSKQLAEGDVEVVLDRFPYSLAFDYNGDIELISIVKKAAAGQPNSVIGVDQEACAIHPFGHLAGAADSYHARQLSKCLQLKALFLSGRYIRTDYQDELQVLRTRLPSGSAATEVVDAVSDSVRIFVDHVEGRVGQSVKEREQRMMRVFDVARGEVLGQQPDARFLFKMGGAHTVRGIGPNGIETFGQHIADQATQDDQQSLHVSIYPWREEGAVPLPKSCRHHDYVLLDCKLLEPHLDSHASWKNNTELKGALAQSDFIILIPAASRASKSQITSKQKRFVRSKLVGFGLVLIPVLLVLPIYGTALVRCFQWIRGKQSDVAFCGRCPLVVSAGLFTLIAIQVAMLLLAPQTASPTGVSMVLAIEILMVVAVLAVMWSAGKTLRGANPKAQQIFYLMGAVGCLGMAFFIHAWGLGHLLGI